MAKHPVTKTVEQETRRTYRRVNNDGPVATNRPPLSAKATAARMRRDADALRQSDEALFLRTSEEITRQAAAVAPQTEANHPLAKILGSRKGDPMLDVWMANVEEYRDQKDEKDAVHAELKQ